jgi:hypothetical protein
MKTGWIDNVQEMRWTNEALTVLEKTSTMWFPFPRGALMLKEILNSKARAPIARSLATQTIQSKPTNQKNEHIRV